MSTVRERLVPPFVETDAEIVERGPICIEAFTVRPVYRNKLRYEVDDLPELCFLFADLVLGLLALGDIHHGTYELNEVAGWAREPDGLLGGYL